MASAGYDPSVSDPGTGPDRWGRQTGEEHILNDQEAHALYQGAGQTA